MVLLVVILVLATTGCTDNDENGVEEILSVEFTISERGGSPAYYNVKARNLNTPEFDFSMDGKLNDGTPSRFIYNDAQNAFYEFSHTEIYDGEPLEIWFMLKGTQAVQSAVESWILIEGIVDHIQEEGAVDFTFRESDLDTGESISFAVTGITVDRELSDDAFYPPRDALVMDPPDSGPS